VSAAVVDASGYTKVTFVYIDGAGTLTAAEKDTGVDDAVAVGTRLDEGTGEVVPLYKTSREIFEEEAKDKKMLERLKGCT